MLKSYLLENYGYNEPIFLNDLKIEELSENAVRQSVKRLVANGFLERYDNGIYYIPKQGGLLGKSYLDPFLVIMRKYVRSKTETYGYVTGISFVNQLGLTTQMPAIIEIVTNREATNGRTVTVGNQKVRIKKAAVEVSDNNAELLQLLDGIGEIYGTYDERHDRYNALLCEEEAFYERTVIRSHICYNRRNSKKINRMGNDI